MTDYQILKIIRKNNRHIGYVELLNRGFKRYKCNAVVLKCRLVELRSKDYICGDFRANSTIVLRPFGEDYLMKIETQRSSGTRKKVLEFIRLMLPLLIEHVVTYIVKIL